MQTLLAVLPPQVLELGVPGRVIGRMSKILIKGGEGEEPLLLRGDNAIEVFKDHGHVRRR